MYKGIHQVGHDPMATDDFTDEPTSIALAGGSIGISAALLPQSPDPLGGAKWASNTITWSFATSNLPSQPATFSGPVTDPAQQALVEKAAAMWQSVSGIDLVLVADSASVDIRVGFAALGAASGGLIGLTNWNSINGNFLPDVMVSAEDPAQVGITQLSDGDFVYNGFVSRLFQTFAHEFGHALGLDHNTIDDQALMWPVGLTTNLSIDPNDVAAIQQLYGPAAAGNPTINIADNGPVALTVGANSTVHPFANLVVTDGPGLREIVTVTLAGGGTLSDPTIGTDAAFSNGVFTESGENLTSDESGPVNSQSPGVLCRQFRRSHQLRCRGRQFTVGISHRCQGRSRRVGSDTRGGNRNTRHDNRSAGRSVRRALHRPGGRFAGAVYQHHQ